MNAFKATRLNMKKYAKDPSQYSLRALAKRIPITASALCDIENDKMLPNLVTFALLCRHYELTLPEIRNYLSDVLKAEDKKNEI